MVPMSSGQHHQQPLHPLRAGQRHGQLQPLNHRSLDGSVAVHHEVHLLALPNLNLALEPQRLSRVCMLHDDRYGARLLQKWISFLTRPSHDRNAWVEHHVHGIHRAKRGLHRGLPGSAGNAPVRVAQGFVQVRAQQDILLGCLAAKVTVPTVVREIRDIDHNANFRLLRILSCFARYSVEFFQGATKRILLGEAHDVGAWKQRCIIGLGRHTVRLRQRILKGDMPGER
mmetsp:Transcript_55562/g.121702  ORF Transcript_55562/g.121702 Transcript_55562/m.121702 type:complete len:228 (-) Transcript_55562:557-1240(-)